MKARANVKTFTPIACVGHESPVFWTDSEEFG